jgi:hypothetical protein
MFQRLFHRSPRPVEPTLDTDPAQDDLDLRAARARACDGDWTAARDVVEAAGGDWELRGRRIAVLSMVAADDGAWLDAWLDAAPDDPAAAAIVASSLSTRAGQARGGASAAKTSRAQFDGFAELSAQAATASHRAIALAPHDPVPWAQVLNTMFASGRSRRAEFAEAFAEGRRRDPYNFELHLTAVSFVCEKWYGSHEEMFAAARDVAAAAPAGASAVMLPFLAHFEYAMREYSWDKRTEAARADCRRYFQRPDVQRELDACVAKWRAAGPPRLGRAMTCRNWQALGYTLAGRRDEAKAVFDEIGPYVGSTPAWGYFHLRQSEGFLAGWRWASRGR